MTPPERRHRRSRLSAALTEIDRIASRPAWAAVVLTFDIVWVVYSVSVGFPSRLETIFQTLVAALTLGMVFVIQHTQGRQQAATQRKLDEILNALPRADNAVISLEHAPEHEIVATGHAHRRLRHAAIADLTRDDVRGRPPADG